MKVTFDGPVDIDRILFDIGAADGYLKYERPREVVVAWAGGSTVLSLRDDASPQVFSVGIRQAVEVTIAVVSVYAAAGSTVVGVSEVEFFAMR